MGEHIAQKLKNRRLRGLRAQARNRRETAVPSPVNTSVITKTPPPNGSVGLSTEGADIMKNLLIGAQAAGGRVVTPERSKSAVDPSDIVTQFTEQVDHFVTSRHVNQPEAVRRFVEAVAPQGDERALDVACGRGCWQAFAPHVGEYIGIDLTPAMVEKAAATAREVGLSNARFEVLQENVIGDRNKDVDEISLKKENWPESWFWPAAFCCGAAGNRTRDVTCGNPNLPA